MMCDNGVRAWPVVIRDRCGLCGAWLAACAGSAGPASTRLLRRSAVILANSGKWVRSTFQHESDKHMGMLL
eukprot:2327044-Amphidinium_carterae.1